MSFVCSRFQWPVSEITEIMVTTVDSRKLELLREIEKSSSYKEFEFSNRK